MIENRDIHSYNCDVYIIHKANLYQVNVLNGLEIHFERKGSPGKCTFEVAQEKDGKIEFEEGDEVSVRISQTWLFKGYIFTKERSKDNIIKFTCYDQLRYLQASEAVVIENKSVGEITTDIIKSRSLKKGTIRDSEYKIPAIIRDNISFLDLIQLAIEKTTTETGEHFIFYDRFGELTLCPLKHMRRNVVINAGVAEDFDYKSTIDDNTYNMVRVSFKSKSNGDTVYVTEKDQKNIDKWGMLQKTIEADDGWNAKTVAHNALSIYNSKTKTLKIRNGMGANELVAGTVVTVDLDLGDMKLSQNMIVDVITHRIDDGLYSMDVDLIGGEFVSTLGSQGEPQEKTKTTDEEDKLIENASYVEEALDWGHGVHVEQIDKVLNGVLQGKGYLYLKWGNAFKVNPLMVACFTKKECSVGGVINSRLAREQHNYGGITSAPGYPRRGRFVDFPDMETGIKMMFRLFSVYYFHQLNLRTLAGILNLYAPPSENNTAAYVREMRSWYKKYSGRTWTDAQWGPGVKTMAEAEQRIIKRTTNTVANATGGSSSNHDVTKLSPRTLGYTDNAPPSVLVERACYFAKCFVNTKYDQNRRNSWAERDGDATHFDCSAFTYYAYAYAGRNKKKPFNAWTTDNYSGNPKAYGLRKVPLSLAKRGDVLWMTGHSGLYLGNGMAAESGGQKNGGKVHLNGRAGRFSCAYRFKDFP